MTTPTTKYAESYLATVMGAVGLDVEYVRAQGDTLFRRDDAGTEVPVLDLLSGYGSLILGHNNPEILACAKQLMNTDAPVHAQFSVQPPADQVGAVLNEIVHREFHCDERYAVAFANSGAEAIEAALKHAELSRVLKVAALADQLEFNVDHAVAALRDGTATLPVSTLVSGHEPPATVAEFEELLGELAAHNAAQFAKAPVFLALERAFHGKLVGSVKLTHNPTVRGAFGSLGVTTRFVPVNQPEALKQIIADERATVYDVVVTDGRIDVVARDFPIVAALFAEPVQGEGGVLPLTEEFGRFLRQTCDEIGCPVVVDEIQTGMGRTGTFFASSQIGLRGDYFVLAKSLGGGITKISALLVRDSVYRPEFELVHGSSTFAKDGFSTAIALRILELLEAGDGAAYRRAAERGDRVMAALREVAAAYPDVIKDVRGKGLLIGVELHDQDRCASAFIREKSLGGWYGMLVSAYLLRVHGIRLAPTGSAPNVLRIEPSINLSDAEIDHLAHAFEQVCVIVRSQDALHLVHPLTSPALASPRTEVRDFRAPVAESTPPATPARKVGFVSYLRTPGMFRDFDPSLADLSDDAITSYARRMAPLKAMTPLPAVRFDSPLGASVDLTLYPLLVTAEQLAEDLSAGRLAAIAADVDARVRAARQDGCELAGIGELTAEATGHGSALRVPKIGVTSGAALTAASGVEALLRAAGQEAAGGTAVVIGAGTAVGTTAAALLADEMSRIVLIGAGQDAVHQIYQDVSERIASGAALSGIAAALAEHRRIGGGTVTGGVAIAEYVRERYGNDPFVVLTDDEDAVREGHVVLAAAPIPAGARFRDGAVVCDLAEAGAVPARGGVRYVRGGVFTTPAGVSLPDCARGPLGAGEVFASVAEVVVLGLAGVTGRAAASVSAREVAKLAREHGFHVAE